MRTKKVLSVADLKALAKQLSKNGEIIWTSETSFEVWDRGELLTRAKVLE